MGVESVSYWYKPERSSRESFREWLVHQGATAGAKASTFVLSGPDHWFDFLVRASGEAVDQVQIRVALTNPVSALLELHRLLSDLLNQCGGTVADLAADRVFEQLDDDGMDVFSAGFLARRAEFIEQFGDYVWPVSADEVLSRLRDAREC